MDKTITVTVSTDNTPALAAFARAFAELAGSAPVVTGAPEPITFPTITDTAPAKPALPWDERIHASSRATNKDGSWTLRRKPKDLTDDEWAARIEQVTAELEALMAIPAPVAPAYSDAGYTAEDHAAADPVVPTPPPVELPPINAITEADLPPTDIPELPTVQPPVIAPELPPLPPVTPPAPVTTDVTDFPGLMKWLTTNLNATNKHLVDEVLKRQQLTALPQLNQRPDLIPGFVVELAGLLV